MFEKNKKELKKYYEDLYYELVDHKCNDKFKLIKNKKQDYNILIDNKTYINSKYDPKREANSFINSFELKDEDTILIFGLGLGYYLDILKSRYSEKKIIIVEPEMDIFIKALEIRNFTEYFKDENIVFIINKDKYSIRNIIEHYVENSKVRNIHFTQLPSYSKLYKTYIADVHYQLKNFVKTYKANIYTEIISSNRWVYNNIRNMEFIKKYNSVDKIKDELEGVPIVIVSAGPSLDKNMHLLNGLKRKALIVAVGSSVNILEKNNIVPHIIMGIDGNLPESLIFKNVKTDRPLMIYSSTIHYESLLHYRGKKMYITLKDNTFINDILKKLDINTNKFITGGSVANLALDFAVWMNSSSIVLLGQDLCYTEDKLYAEGAIHQTKMKNKNNYVKLTDIYGEDVYTGDIFLNYKNWFEDYVNVFNVKKDIYNCTEGGLNIEGIPNKRFEEIIESKMLKEYDIENTLISLAIEEVDIDIDKYEKIREYYYKDVKESIKISKQRLKLLDELQEDIEFNKEFDKLIKQTKKLEKKKLFKNFIKNCGERYRQAIEIGANNSINEMESIEDKREKLLEALKLQYEDIHEKLLIALDAFEGKDVEGLF